MTDCRVPPGQPVFIHRWRPPDHSSHRGQNSAAGSVWGRLRIDQGPASCQGLTKDNITVPKSWKFPLIFLLLDANPITFPLLIGFHNTSSSKLLTLLLPPILALHINKLFNDRYHKKVPFPHYVMLFVCEIWGGNPLDKAFIDVHTKKFSLIEQSIGRLQIFT